MAVAATLLLFAVYLARREPLATRESGSDGTQWLQRKYEHLSSVVPLTNWWRFGDATADDTMHAALWNGTAWDLGLTNRLAAHASLDILLGRDTDTQRSASGDTVRMLDAGCGWGGTIFTLEAHRQDALRSSRSSRTSPARPAPLARYDGLTLAPTQARAANEKAARLGLEATAHFAVGSFEAPLPAATYGVVVAIESIEHAAELRRCVRHLGSALRVGGVLVVVTDLLLDQEARRDSPLLAAYRTHWCGPHTAGPATLAEWHAHLGGARLRLATRTDLSAQLYRRPRWALTGYLRALLLAHRLAASLGLQSTTTHTSTQIGGVARELALHDGLIAYTFMVARRVSG